MKSLYTNELNAPVYYRLACTSTMDIAHRLANQGVPHGTVVVTAKQYAGRGQHSRTWSAKRGEALLCSVIVRPRELAISTSKLQSITLRAACAVNCMLREKLNISAHIRWPNDILIEDKKVCGILGEYRGGSDGSSEPSSDYGALRRTQYMGRNSDTKPMPNEYIAIGIGLNCCQRYFPQGYDTEPTSLYLSGRERRVSNLPLYRKRTISPRALLKPLITSLCRVLTEPQSWLEDVNNCLWRRGGVVSVRPAISSQAAFNARVIDVVEDGSLRLTRTDDTGYADTDTADNSRIEHLYAGSIRSLQ